MLRRWRQRRARREARLDLAVDQVRRRHGGDTWEDWRGRIGGAPLTWPLDGDDGVRVEVEATWDGSPEGTIRVWIGLQQETFHFAIPTRCVLVHRDRPPEW